MKLLNKIRYKYHIPIKIPDVYEDTDGVRKRRDCLCCHFFAHTYKEWRKRIGICNHCGNVSEYGQCIRFKAKNNEQMAKLNEWGQ